MSKVSVSVDVSKEAYELGLGLVNFAGAVKVALANGWQLTDDMPAIVAAAFSELVPAVSGASELPAEFQEDQAAFVQAFTLAAGGLLKVFQGK